MKIEEARTDSQLRVEPVDASQGARWQKYVSAHPDATLFHDLRWSQCVTTAFGHRPFHLWAWRGAQLVGVLPLMEVRSRFAGRLLVSVPYATYGGVLTDDVDTGHALLSAAKRLAEDLSARCLEFRSIRSADTTLPVRRSHATFGRALPETADEVLATIPRKARAAARRAQERHDLHAEFDESRADDVWNLYSRSMRRLGSPNYPRRFFHALAEAFGREARWLLVRQGRQPVAGLLSFYHRGRAMPYFFGMDERRGLYGLSQYVYWQSMRDAVEQGCTRFDFGRTRYDNPGPFEFKRLFGFEPTPLEYQSWMPAGGRAPSLSPGAPRWRLARSVWKKLPLAIARPLGAWVSRSIPG